MSLVSRSKSINVTQKTLEGCSDAGLKVTGEWSRLGFGIMWRARGHYSVHRIGLVYCTALLEDSRM